jgi:hypothetical protein
MLCMEREFRKSVGNVAEEHMVHIKCVAELNACFVEIIVSDFTQLLASCIQASYVV